MASPYLCKEQYKKVSPKIETNSHVMVKIWKYPLWNEFLWTESVVQWNSSQFIESTFLNWRLPITDSIISYTTFIDPIPSWMQISSLPLGKSFEKLPTRILYLKLQVKNISARNSRMWKKLMKTATLVSLFHSGNVDMEGKRIILLMLMVGIPDLLGS